jgi:hypothetical protein
MKCFYHPVSDAVGTCAQCNKAACRQCVQDIGGILLCVGCLSLRQHQAELEEKAIGYDRRVTMQRARNRIRASWIVGGIGLVFGIFPGIAQASEAMKRNDMSGFSVILLPLIVVFFIVFTGYLFWSMFWGTPVVWGWTKAFVKNFSLRSFDVTLPVLVILLSCCISIPLSVAIYYSVFGGGIYQYFKYRRIAAGNFQVG